MLNSFELEEAKALTTGIIYFGSLEALCSAIRSVLVVTKSAFRPLWLQCETNSIPKTNFDQAPGIEPGSSPVRGRRSTTKLNLAVANYEFRSPTYFTD